MSGFRKNGRKKVNCIVSLSHRDLGDMVTEAHDISETGVFIRCHELAHVVSVGETVDAKFYAENQKYSASSLKVVRHTLDGVGLAFV